MYQIQLIRMATLMMLYFKYGVINSAYSQNTADSYVVKYDRFESRNVAYHDFSPNAQNAKLKIEEIRENLENIAMRESSLLKEVEANKALLVQISIQKSKLEEDLKYWNNVLTSIEAADRINIPKAIYDGSLLKDEKERIALKSKYLEHIKPSITTYVISKSAFMRLPKVKQKIILEAPERYTIIENK
jgi:hypothetical protein